jgi:hypothetical protein
MIIGPSWELYQYILKIVQVISHRLVMIAAIPKHCYIYIDEPISVSVASSYTMSLRYQLLNCGEDFIQPVHYVVCAVIRTLNPVVLRLEDGVFS